MLETPFHHYQHLRRFREIVQVLLRYSFDELVDQLGLTSLLFLPTRFLQQRRASETVGAPQRLRLALEELGPTFIKVGQILSTRPDLLPSAYIDELSKLQDQAPPVPLEDVLQVIETELNWPVHLIFQTFEETPLAAASLSQVHAATLNSGEQVVVKVQRPHIRPQIEEDLSILCQLARLAQEKTAWGEVYDLVDVAEDFANTLRNELDYRGEGRNADRFRRNFAAEEHLYIPKVYWSYTTGLVLTMERISGVKIDNVDGIRSAGMDTKAIALHSSRIIVKETLEDGFFHADPHPGNFVVMPGEVIGAMDFGMVGHLDRYLREDLARLLFAAVNLDAQRVVDQLLHMGAADAQVNRQALQRDINRLLQKYYDMPLKEIRAKDLVTEMWPLAFRHHLHLPSDLWLLGKTLGMMEGVGLKLNPDFDMFAVAKPYAARILRQFTSPKAVGEKMLSSAGAWGDLLLLLPRRIDALLSQLEQGHMAARMEIQNAIEISHYAERVINRLVVSVLTMALILAAALLLPQADFTWPWPVITWLALSSVVVATISGILLWLSIWRSGGT